MDGVSAFEVRSRFKLLWKCSNLQKTLFYLVQKQANQNHVNKVDIQKAIIALLRKPLLR